MARATRLDALAAFVAFLGTMPQIDKVGQALVAIGVIGRFAIDFVVVRRGPPEHGKDTLTRVYMSKALG